MRDLLLSRISLVWIVLVASTLLSWELGHGLGFDTTRAAGATILIITFVKVRLVLLEFMEVRRAPRAMRLAADAWVVLGAVVLVSLFVTGSG